MKLKRILREFNILFQFIKYDISVTFGLALPMTVTACKSLNVSDWKSYTISILKSIVYCAFYTACFVTVGQINFIEEDKINKPDRPLPKGLLTIKQATTRWRCYIVLYIGLSLFFGVAEFGILWCVITFIHSCTEVLTKEYGWAIKNLSMSLGTVSQLGSAWKMVAGNLSNREWFWIVIFSVGVFFVAGVQDLRDIRGDKLVKRKTLPIVFDEANSRIYHSIAMITITYIWNFMVLHNVQLLYTLINCIISCIVSVRLVTLRDKNSDERTYYLMVWWHIVALAGCYLEV